MNFLVGRKLNLQNMIQMKINVLTIMLFIVVFGCGVGKKNNNSEISKVSTNQNGFEPRIQLRTVLYHLRNYLINSSFAPNKINIYPAKNNKKSSIIIRLLT